MGEKKLIRSLQIDPYHSDSLLAQSRITVRDRFREVYAAINKTTYFLSLTVVQNARNQERMMTSLFFHGGGGRACDFVFSRGESRIFRVY